MNVAATLNGHRVMKARVSIPAWGLWFAEVDVDGEVELAGKVTLVISDLVLRGSVLSGGKSLGRSHYRIVAGAGGWGKLLPAKGYQNDAGVKLANVIGNAAEEADEAIFPIDPKLTVGPAWTRTKDEPASRVLELTQPQAWYVDEEGTLRLGKRTPGTLPTGITRIAPVDRNRRSLTIASNSIAAILPGITLDGLEVVDVEHVISADGLRSKLWGTLAGSSSRAAAAMQALFEQLDPDRIYRGPAEFRIVTQNGNRLNLQPIRVSSGMPNLNNVYVRPGIAGAKHSYALGARVVVQFLEADPSRHFVSHIEDADGEGFTPIETLIKVSSKLDLGDSGGPAVGRVGDSVNCGYLVFATTAPLSIDSYFPGTIAGLADATQKVSDLGGPPASIFPLNTDLAHPATAAGGAITSGAEKVNAA